MTTVLTLHFPQAGLGIRRGPQIIEDHSYKLGLLSCGASGAL